MSSSPSDFSSIVKKHGRLIGSYHTLIDHNPRWAGMDPMIDLLLKPQSMPSPLDSSTVDLATAATHIGFTIEPNPCTIGKSFDWIQAVREFPAPEKLGQDVRSYHAPAVLLQLGPLSSQPENRFELSSKAAARLEYLGYLHSNTQHRDYSAAKTPDKNLLLGKRTHIGEFFFAIVDADEQIAPEKMQVLEKTYPALGLTPSGNNHPLLFVTLQPDEATTPAEIATSFRLDKNLVKVIMQKTAQVNQFLRHTMREDGEGETEAPQPDYSNTKGNPTPDVDKPQLAALTPEVHSSKSAIGAENGDQFDPLLVRFRPFLIAATKRSRWARKDLDNLARSHHLMLGDAIEKINDWSSDKFEDLLFVESDDEIEVQLSFH